MPEFVPDTEELAESTAKAAARGESVYVEGPVGAGRTSLVEALKRRDGDRTAVVELLPVDEADAAGVLLLEAASYLPTEDAPQWGSGSERELHTLARAVGDCLRDQGKVLVLRIPDSWQDVEFRSRRGDVLPLRARSVLVGLLSSRVGLIVVADAALTPSSFNFHPVRRYQLPAHRVQIRSLEKASWGPYADAFEGICGASSRLAVSPLAWRLAVGCVGLGAPPKAVLEPLGAAAPLPALAAILAKRVLKHAGLAAALTRFLAVRRPLERSAIPELTQVSDEHLALFTECVGYGEVVTRVSPVVRGLLREKTRAIAMPGTQDHQKLAKHYLALDGAPSPKGLPPDQLRAWSERAHHLAIGSDAASPDWDQLELPAPSFYWDRGRYLSKERRNFAAAAEVYRACVARFPDDDYSWHYAAFNQARAGRGFGTVEKAYQRAIELDPENPWWNRRFVEHQIRTGAIQRARTEWRRAQDRVDPDGTLVRRSPWLAHNFHFGVCRAWMATGRYKSARGVLELVPSRFKKRGAFATLARQLKKHPPAWRRYLEALSENQAVGPQLAQHVRRWWGTLSAAVDLAPPLAELTADGERFQFAWSYDNVLVEVEIHRDGSMEWFAKNRESGKSEDGEMQQAGEPGAALRPWLEMIRDV